MHALSIPQQGPTSLSKRNPQIRALRPKQPYALQSEVPVFPCQRTPWSQDLANLWATGKI